MSEPNAPEKKVVLSDVPDPLAALLRHGVSEEDARAALEFALTDDRLTLAVYREVGEVRVGDLLRAAGDVPPQRADLVAPGFPGRYVVVGPRVPGASADIVVPATTRRASA